MRKISFELVPVPPFRLDLTAWVLRRRPDNIVDRWDGRNYRRVIVIGDRPTEVIATQTGSQETPRLCVTVIGKRLPSNAGSIVTAALTRLLGLDIDLKEFYRLASRDKTLRPLMRRFKGFKPPRFLMPFEALVNGITCQQLSLSFGIQVLNRLATNFGQAIETPQGYAYAFPRPMDLIDVKPEALRKLSYSCQKARALLDLSTNILQGGVDLDRVEKMTDGDALKCLDDLRGVGRWTAEYALLRGFGRLHVFPADDVGVRHSLERWLKLGKPLDYESTIQLLARWKPHAGLIYFHLLLYGLAKGGYMA